MYTPQAQNASSQHDWGVYSMQLPANRLVLSHRMHGTDDTEANLAKNAMAHKAYLIHTHVSILTWGKYSVQF